MATMHHQVWIDAEPKQVYEALATTTGIEGWWTDRVESDEEEGGTLTVGFEGGTVEYTFEIAEHSPGHRVVWDCMDGPEEWVDTELYWEMMAGQDGGTVLLFKHMDWEQASEFFALCNSTWGALMFVLKDFVEGKSPGPWFEG